jgi:hypothetical protein
MLGRWPAGGAGRALAPRLSGVTPRQLTDRALTKSTTTLHLHTACGALLPMRKAPRLCYPVIGGTLMLIAHAQGLPWFPVLRES